VLISTDKAVNPTNVMGMSKRVAELLMMSAARKHPGRFAAVRFGNVLGSRGSVIPIFERQIAAGGPLTITDAQMTRYFMSIPEATLLVLKASALNGVGSLFVLNMGDPVRIVDMAHDVIRLSGLIPERDIKITTVGVRPGEKMHEELFWDYETHVPVEGGAIFSVQLSDAYYERLLADVPSRVEALIRAARAYDEAAVRQQMQALVFTQPATERTNGKVLEGHERESSGHH
jgi:FlaA1/EpsC-like NDP-sugar epimerase